MQKHIGRLEVITGSMFSGKSEELICRIRRANYAKQKLLVFSPSIDNRYGENGIYSHNNNNFKAFSISDVNDMFKILDDNPDCEVIGIDEIQFFDKKVVEFCKKCVHLGKRVIVAGLDLDFRAIPFEPLPYLMAIADEVNKLCAICTKCGNPAYASQRLINGKPAYEDDPILSIGSSEKYEARCRLHHIVKRRNEFKKNIQILINLTNDNHNLYDDHMIINFDCSKKVYELREQINDYRNKYENLAIIINDSISSKIEGDYTILDLLSEYIQIIDLNIIANSVNVSHIISINDLLNRYEMYLNRILLSDKNCNLEKLLLNTGIKPEIIGGNENEK